MRHDLEDPVPVPGDLERRLLDDDLARGVVLVDPELDLADPPERCPVLRVFIAIRTSDD